MSLAVSVRRGAAVRWWPLRLMVTSWRGLEGTDDAFDADSGGVLEVADYGQGGHHHRQVGPGGVTGVVEDGAGPQVVLAHPERLLDVPQLVIGGDHLTGIHQMRGDER